MAERSPNFPQLSLREALDSVRLIYQKEGRSKMPRLSAVKPLGYTSINGRSLGVLGALRAYNLLDGRGDDIRISDDAFAILNAPQGAAERREALIRAFEAPAAFAVLRAQGDASPDTMKWHLQKANFRDESADKLLKVYLESKEFLNAEIGSYHTDLPDEDGIPDAGSIQPTGEDSVRGRPVSASLPFRPLLSQAAPPRALDTPEVQIGVHERVLQSGLLSKGATYRVIVSGHVGVVEIERLLKKLEVDKEILADPDPELESKPSITLDAQGQPNSDGKAQYDL